MEEGIKIAGLDEVGKGCLFGPVFAAAVMLNNSSENQLLDAGLKDSKLLTKAKRAQLFPEILKLADNWGIGQASAKEIDSQGIRKATEKAMLRAIHKLTIHPSLLLIDGSLPLRLWKGNQENLIRGESKSPAIAAASVIAKESRDQVIKRLAKQFPGYGLETNVGYGTSNHRKALIKSGPTQLHRKSFLSKIIFEDS
ncbi:ribonuclease HII [Prochlorococcus marinus]|uniref:Ribonuclease HII n=1 Tax=Prochlorococcus marinus (strain MIT 9211) TaxID=93059 RepID=A9BCJ4_PROM4|nr:Ribonuclease HII and HIII [Prochlorococcus marinus str. MIT 9211]